ncbi:hypothetical protein D3C78_1155610 [compost metagenome]
MHHGGVGPPCGAFHRDGRGDRLFLALQRVHLVRPGTGRGDAFVLEVAHLHRRVVPVAVDQFLLVAQQLDRRGVLLFVQLVGVGDAQRRLGGLQVERRIGDIDRPVIGLYAALVALAVGQVLLGEHHVPAFRCLGEDLGVVHQHVRPPLVGRAVVDAVDGMPRAVLQALVDVLPVRDQVGIDRLHALAVDQPQRGVAGGGDQVVAALGHQADHLVGGGGGLHVDLAAGVLLELGHPVVVLVAFTAFDVAGPGDDVEGTFGRAELFERFGGLQRAAGDDTDAGESQGGEFQ